MAAVKIKGSKKWAMKNRVKVGFLTAKPPHTHWTRDVPRYGIAESKFVITVAPQKDIWPQGRTYPKKAVPITKNIRITPMVQVLVKMNEL